MTFRIQITSVTIEHYVGVRVQELHKHIKLWMAELKHKFSQTYCRTQQLVD
jgi:hypothetical protein